MPDQSIAELLRQSVENATDPEPLTIQLPVFDPPVTMVLRKIKDVKEREAAMAGLEQIKDETDRGLQAVARMLVLACEHCTITVDGTTHELPKVGLPLWSYIFGDTTEPPLNDVEAVYALYTDSHGEADTVALTDAATEYVQWTKNAALRAHQEALGESVPA